MQISFYEVKVCSWFRKKKFIDKHHSQERVMKNRELRANNCLIETAGGMALAVATVMPPSVGAAAESIADAHAIAHRLAACWNACDGIPTELLDTQAQDIRAWVERKRIEAVDMAERNLELKAQRDEFRALLAEVMDSELGAVACIGSDAPFEDLMGRIQAALAKPTGREGGAL